MDYKPHPEKFDFKRDIMCINRTTGRMLLSALTLITPQKEDCKSARSSMM